jgi:Spy/CpxP family protein refolding chaperone
MRGMNFRLGLLVLCLGGNVLLAFALFRPAASSPSSLNSVSAAGQNPAPTPIEVADGTTSVLPMAVAAGDFSWAEFTLADYARYLAELRAFGTPERQVREIIIGAIDASYRPKRAALMPPPKKRADGKFWQRRNFFGNQSTQTKEQRAQMRALRKEEAELVKSLFGADIYELMAKDSGETMGIDWTEKMYGFLPKELREKVQEIEQDMNEDRQEIYALDEDDWQGRQEDERKLEKKYHDQLAKLLTPEQLVEWDLRHSQTANQLKNDLSVFDPTEDEFRALFKYKQDQEALNQGRDPGSDAAPPTADERKAQREKQKALDAELAQTLGTNRAAEYKLEQDYSFRQLIEAGVAKESVFKLADMKKDAETAANKIRRDQTLTPDQKNAALAAIRNETQTSMDGLLDEKQLKRYLNQGGWWLNNIAPKTQPATSP